MRMPHPVRRGSAQGMIEDRLSILDDEPALRAFYAAAEDRGCRAVVITLA